MHQAVHGGGGAANDLVSRGPIDGDVLGPATAAREVHALSRDAPGFMMGDEHGAYTGIGVFGQYLWIDPAASLVIAKFASQPLPTDEAVDADTARCFRAVGEALAG